MGYIFTFRNISSTKTELDMGIYPIYSKADKPSVHLVLIV